MEATGEDSLAKSTRAEAASGAATVDGAVATGVPGTALGGRGRPSDKSINQSLLVSMLLFLYFLFCYISRNSYNLVPVLSGTVTVP